LANAYKFASVFVYPSLYEGFGIPLLEAMHYGCPILASDTSCFPEIAGNAAIYFNPGNVDELVSGMESVILDTGVRNELISNGFKREVLFSWEKCAKETLEFYKYIDR
jgi:glycosyltransferase involved in cell wall biosynthesis